MRHALHSAAFRSSDATIAPSASLAAFLLDPTRLSRRGNDVGNGCSSPLEAAAGHDPLPWTSQIPSKGSKLASLRRGEARIV